MLRSPLIGDFNVDNLLTVLGVLLANGMALEPACQVLGACQAPPGRMQVVGGGALPLAIVDYAHTPDALDNALRAARAHCAGRLLCVFGCGGDRDRGKRPQMGQVAESLADELYITDDNPRSEDPAAHRRRHPRRPASPRARAGCSTIARPRSPRRWPRRSAGDVVLVAGKGHEDYQLEGARAARVQRSGAGARRACARGARREAHARRNLPRACGGRLEGADAEFADVLIDSRKIRAGRSVPGAAR